LKRIIAEGWQGSGGMKPGAAFEVRNKQQAVTCACARTTSAMSMRVEALTAKTGSSAVSVRWKSRRLSAGDRT
jgi:hypothetical protein